MTSVGGPCRAAEVAHQVEAHGRAQIVDLSGTDAEEVPQREAVVGNTVLHDESGRAGATLQMLRAGEPAERRFDGRLLERQRVDQPE